MSIIMYIGFFIIGIYSIIILMFVMGWVKLKKNVFKPIVNPISVSIVIACRNEEHHIIPLIESLIRQTYPKNKTEIIIVDDHSDDNTFNIVNERIKKHEFIKIIRLPMNNSRKKDALTFGIKSSVSDIIITTDADCIMNENWITSLVSYYLTFKPQILSAPVCIKNERLMFQKFQALEFLSLIGTGAGAIGINHPIMSNGANLLFEKSVFIEADLQHNYASGDDVFLMQYAKSNFQNAIHFIKSKDAIVYTKAAKSINEFFNQRIRWTSKSKAYKDFDIILTALIVAFTNLTLIFCLFFSIWNHPVFIKFISIFIIKSVFDLLILIPVSRFFNQQRLLWLFFPLQVIYPFYIVYTVFFGLLGNFQWKNRSFKEKR
ncbi:MAG TPA: hypothetical protein DCG75_13940 [Bacteroidales bacterium]|nr:hypothetical protein [Bacteroidales bacterium]